MTEMAYYDCLFRIQNEMKNKSFLDMAKIWEKYFFDLRNNDYFLPLGLALCHRDFWIDWKGNSFDLTEEGWANLVVSDCQFEKISGIACPWNPSPENLEKDHWWPKSLGGPFSGHNLLGLCRIHNLAKGNGLRGFDWKIKPQWIDSRLDEIYQKKLFGLNKNYV
ncbi:HNH endonuclease [Candidatus Poseidoniales archaeon]|nr:HNH endonuclease [Candidatus Poseidoniales archaeon]MDA8724400.1 HNH endonuclease [Candidatus Poseidoniales archaeon]